MRLIDADALFKDICDSINEMTKIGICVDGEWLWAKLNDALENAPTIEPERKKGRWIFIRPTKEDRLYVACDQCGQVEAWDENCGMLCALLGEKYAHYCPNCGSYNGGEDEV